MKKIIIVSLGLLLAVIAISFGYGLWSKDVIIEGHIEVVPDPEVIANLESKIEDRYARIFELAEQQRIEEALEQKLKEEQENRDLPQIPPVRDQNKPGEQIRDNGDNAQSETQGVETGISVDNKEPKEGPKQEPEEDSEQESETDSKQEPKGDSKQESSEEQSISESPPAGDQNKSWEQTQNKDDNTQNGTRDTGPETSADDVNHAGHTEHAGHADSAEHTDHTDHSGNNNGSGDD